MRQSPLSALQAWHICQVEGLCAVSCTANLLQSRTISAGACERNQEAGDRKLGHPEVC